MDEIRQIGLNCAINCGIGGNYCNKSLIKSKNLFDVKSISNSVQRLAITDLSFLQDSSVNLGWNVALALIILGQELILYNSREDFWCCELQKAEIVVIKEVALTINFVVHSIIKMQSLSVLLRLQLKEF